MQAKNYANVKNILLALAAHVKAKGIQELATYLGVPASTLYSWQSRGKIVDKAVILKKIPNARIEWLETGEGEMLDKEREPETVAEPPGEYGGATRDALSRIREKLSPEKQIWWDEVMKMTDDEALELVLAWRKQRSQDREKR